MLQKIDAFAGRKSPRNNDRVNSDGVNENCRNKNMNFSNTERGNHNNHPKNNLGCMANGIGAFRPSVKITLIDFGMCISRFDKRSRVDLMHKICGTKGYIAPEIILADTLTKRERLDFKKIDTFSVGVILYQMLTRLNPFFAKDSRTILKNNSKCKIDFSVPGIVKLDEDKKDLLTRLCKRDPAKRLSASEALSHPALAKYEWY